MHEKNQEGVLSNALLKIEPLDGEEGTMSKKSRVAHKSVQRHKPKTQKHVELVAQAVPSATKEETLVTLATAHGTHSSSPVVQQETREDGTANHKNSASARLAARKAAPLMTAEELAYVKRDLITIGGLTGVMLIILVVFYVILG